MINGTVVHWAGTGQKNHVSRRQDSHARIGLFIYLFVGYKKECQIKKKKSQEI